MSQPVVSERFAGFLLGHVRLYLLARSTDGRWLPFWLEIYDGQSSFHVQPRPLHPGLSIRFISAEKSCVRRPRFCPPAKAEERSCHFAAIPAGLSRSDAATITTIATTVTTAANTPLVATSDLLPEGLAPVPNG